MTYHIIYREIVDRLEVLEKKRQKLWYKERTTDDKTKLCYIHDDERRVVSEIVMLKAAKNAIDQFGHTFPAVKK